jgi:DNA-binding transcriptional MerR regulator
VDRVQFIQRAQAAGLTLAEIGGVLEVRAEGEPPCEHVTALLESKLGDVDRRIEELGLLRRDLIGLIDRSHRLDPAECDEGSICHILIPAGALPDLDRSPASSEGRDDQSNTEIREEHS